jgi:hypothetical protein
VRGVAQEDEEHFGWVVERFPGTFSLRAGTTPPLLQDALGLTQAHDDDRRGANQEALFRGLYDLPGASGLLVAEGARLEAASPGQVTFGDDPGVPGGEGATLVIDTQAVDWRSLSPVPSLYDRGDGSLHAAGLTGMTLHVLSDTPDTGLRWDTQERAVLR